MNASKHYQEIKEKRNILRDRYGGMMTELDYKSPKSARRAIEEMGIVPTLIGRMKKYDTDLVAKVLVDRRGMA